MRVRSFNDGDDLGAWQRYDSAPHPTLRITHVFSLSIYPIAITFDVQNAFQNYLLVTFRYVAHQSRNESSKFQRLRRIQRQETVSSPGVDSASSP